MGSGAADRRLGCERETSVEALRLEMFSKKIQPFFARSAG
jgi:hypothetical protein